MKIREESAADYEAVADINRAAFETDVEARLVAELRETADPVISLVAEVGDELVGHILFTPVELSGGRDIRLMGLAPMAVRPRFQRRGVGSALVRAGLDACRSIDACAVVVLGHPDYYPRFGFKPSREFGIRSTYDVPEEAFMVKELREGCLSGSNGIASYHPVFDELV